MRAVPKCLEVLREQCLCEVETVRLVCRDDISLQSIPDGVSACEERRPCRGAAVHYVIVIQDDSIVGEGVDARCDNSRTGVT